MAPQPIYEVRCLLHVDLTRGISIGMLFPASCLIMIAESFQVMYFMKLFFKGHQKYQSSLLPKILFIK